MSAGFRILVAEDDPDDIDLLRIAFERARVQADLVFVRHGCEFIQYLEGTSKGNGAKPNPLPNLMLVDLKMPMVDGFEALEWIRGRSEFHNIPVIVCSGSDQPIDIQRAFELGAQRYLVKPHRLEDLVQMVKNLEKFWTRRSPRQESGHKPGYLSVISATV